MVEKTTSEFTLKSSNGKPNAVKFLCSYGGKILPRHPDGTLRYVGGEIRVLSVDRTISFRDLLLKLQELCGSSVSLRCQLPKEDLDALVSITSDEDLANVIEEYDRANKVTSTTSKIRAFLSSPKSISPPASLIADSGAAKYSVRSSASMVQQMAVNRCVCQMFSPVVTPNQMPYYPCGPRGNPNLNQLKIKI